MSDTTPAPLCKARCSAACSTCARYTRILLAISCATLLCALVSAVLGISTALDDGPGSDPKPVPSSSPSTTAPADPSPTPTDPEPTPTDPAPTEPEPTSTPCNMFDPECSSGGSSGGTDPTPTAPDGSDGSGGGNGSGGLFGGTTS